MEKLVLVFESEKTGIRVQDMIERTGIAQCFLCHSAAEAKRLIYSQNVSLVVCGYKFRDETAESLFEDLPNSCYGLVLAPQSILDLISCDRLFKAVAPVTRGELLTSVQMLLQMERGLHPRRTKEEQEEIEAAKQILMTQFGLTENQAHRCLQKKSMDSGMKLLETAHMVLDGTWKDWYNK